MLESFEPVETFHQSRLFRLRKLHNVSGKKFVWIVSDSLIDIPCFNPVNLGDITIEQNAMPSDLDNHAFQIFNLHHIAHLSISDKPTKLV